MTYPRAQLPVVVRVPPRESNRYVTHSMFTSDVSKPYERGDLTYRQSLDKLLNNIDLQHCSATDMLRMKESIRQRTFDDGLFEQLFLSKPPQKVKIVLTLYKNNFLDDLTASDNSIIEIAKTSNPEILSIKQKPQTAQNDVLELCLTRTGHDRKRSQTLEDLHENDLSLGYGR
ncbi:unnamed protein product [Schistosoma curassoni]|uniref:Uncharacterized protein n=1 Tax=Schistosoma curassoni TaxID=6186 RepID=A0A183KYV0_9TREM|nr:unnamed protein product [Schistosoma curassoni]